MLNSEFKPALLDYEKQGLQRNRFTIILRSGNKVVVDGQKASHFCSNDYLNLSDHPELKKACIRGVEQYGLGSGASNLISGYHAAHAAFEKAYCEFMQRDRALLFNSGYHANLAMMTALTDKKSVITADKYCHASLIDGMLLARAKHHRYLHHDLNHAKTLLKKYSQQKKCLVSESIFSMQGTLANVKKLAQLAKEHKALLIIDDAHGFGILGKSGRGIVEHAELTQEMLPGLITPLGKAFGSFGAIVSGPHDFIETLIQFARSYCYTTSLPPALSVANCALLNILAKETWRREKLFSNIDFFIQNAKKRQLPLLSGHRTPIQSIFIGDNHKTVLIQKTLLNKGFFVSNIRPPTVASHAACIRISLNCFHEEIEINELLDHLTTCLFNIK